MALTERETVVVEDTDRNDRTAGSWLIPLVLIVLLILAFFYFGGFNLFGGAGSTTDNDTINIDTPDNVQVQPTNPTNP